MHVDLVGPLPPSRGFTYLLTCVDRFTRWPEAVPLNNCTSESVARAFLERWVAQFGCPGVVTTDRGAHFEGAFSELLKMLGCQHHRTTAYHPAANGMVERFHRQLKAALMAHGNSDWTDSLPLVLLGIRSTHKALLHSTVAERAFGHTLTLPGEYFSPTKIPQGKPLDYVRRLRARLAQLKPLTPRSQTKTTHLPTHLENCTRVFLRTDQVRQPLQPPYTGPYTVLRRNSKTYVIERKGKRETVSIDRLKPAFVDDEPDTPPEVNAPTPPPAGGSADDRVNTPPRNSKRLIRRPVRFAYAIDIPL